MTLEQRVMEIINEVFKNVETDGLDNNPLFNSEFDRLDSAPDLRMKEQYEAYLTNPIERLR